LFDEELTALNQERGWDLLALDDALSALSEVDPE
jgi:hypothetical protein